ncbi:MAG: MerR family transcriptional regulator [Planctomycetes bacterium]|nr:MerR family transcriptional regulator [Planctomycetota bacterium]
MAAPGENPNPLIRIGNAAKAAGVSKQTLQYYLMVGLVEPSERSPTGQQLFNQQLIERIRLIKKLNDSGYPLREIREIFLRR